MTAAVGRRARGAGGRVGAVAAPGRAGRPALQGSGGTGSAGGALPGGDPRVPPDPEWDPVRQTVPLPLDHPGRTPVVVEEHGRWRVTARLCTGATVDAWCRVYGVEVRTAAGDWVRISGAPSIATACGRALHHLGAELLGGRVTEEQRAAHRALVASITERGMR